MLSHIAAHHALSDNDMQLDSDSASNSPMSALSPIRQQIKYDSDADDDDDARLALLWTSASSRPLHIVPRLLHDTLQTRARQASLY